MVQLGPSWLKCERLPPILNCTSATDPLVSSTNQVDLKLQINDLCKRVTFVFISDLAFPIIAEMTYQNQFFDTILCTARQVRPVYSRNVVICGRP